MSERHTRGAQRVTPVSSQPGSMQPRGQRAGGAAADWQWKTARNGLPPLVPYEWNRAGLEREAQVAAQLAATRRKARGEPDPNGVSYEWRREQLAELADGLAGPPAPPAVRAERPRCGRCGYLTAKCCCVITIRQVR